MHGASSSTKEHYTRTGILARLRKNTGSVMASMIPGIRRSHADGTVAGLSDCDGGTVVAVCIVFTLWYIFWRGEKKTTMQVWDAMENMGNVTCVW